MTWPNLATPARAGDDSYCVFLLFTRMVGGVSRIHIMNADGSGVAMLPQPTGNNYWPSWAPARATGAVSASVSGQSRP